METLIAIIETKKAQLDRLRVRAPGRHSFPLPAELPDERLKATLDEYLSAAREAVPVPSTHGPGACVKPPFP